MSFQTKNAFEVKWSIENMNCWLQSRDDSLYSPQFLAETLMNTCWKLKLTPNWFLEEKYMSLSLQRDVEDDGPDQIVLNYEFSFLARDGSPLKSKSYLKKFASKTVSDELNVKQAKILEEGNGVYLPDGVLTVCCKMWKAWSALSTGAKCSIRTEIGTKCIELDGAIDNFVNLNPPSNVTLNFSSPSSEISLISFHVKFRSQNYVRLERTAVECKCFSRYFCDLFVLDSRGQKIQFCKPTDLATLLTYHNSCTFDSKGTWNYYRDINIFQNNTFKFKLEITYYPGVKSEFVSYETDGSPVCESAEDEDSNLARLFSNLSNSPQHLEPADRSYEVEGNESSEETECSTDIKKKPFPFTTLKEDLTSLHNDRLFCDTKLQTDTETFPAHRCVLSARSPVFKRMFSTDMKERAGECVNVPDISSDTLRRMLQFLYTDRIDDLDMQIAKDLYIASDKYDILSLKQRCSFFMKKNLCPSNVCEVLVLADMHQDGDLESAAQEYVLTYDEDVFGSTEWKLFMQNCSGLAVKVMYLKCINKLTIVVQSKSVVAISDEKES